MSFDAELIVFCIILRQQPIDEKTSVINVFQHFSSGNHEREIVIAQPVFLFQKFVFADE
jgi:ABC-type dipeptide/oligopeptide/nickel transport system ATPase component